MSEVNLITKLLNVQKELKAPKGQYNNFGKYKYRSAEDILEAVKPLNAENGLLLTIKDDIELIGDRYYIKATAKITDGTDVHEVTAYARESLNKKGMDESQITGTASSYARKYALNGLYLIDDTKDADTDEYAQQANKGGYNGNKQANNNQQQKMASDEEMKLLSDKTKQLAELTNMAFDKVVEQLNITPQMTRENFIAVLKRVQNGIEKNGGNQ